MTSGIELEVLAFAHPGVNPIQHLRDALRKPVLLECSKCHQAHSWKLPFKGLVDYEGQVLTKGYYAEWFLTYDCSVGPDEDEFAHVPQGSSFFPLEIVSRIMNFTKPTACPLGQKYPCTGEPFEWDAQTEISTVMQRIREVFSRPGFCLANNKNTGLHIHFGIGKEKPSVYTALGMYGIFAALERLFDSMLTCSRIPILPCSDPPQIGIQRPSAVYKYDQSIEENRWIGSLSFVLLQSLRGVFKEVASGRLGEPREQNTLMTTILQHANVPGMLDDIAGFEDIESFVRYNPNRNGNVYRKSRYLAINLTNLCKQGCTCKCCKKSSKPKDKKCSKTEKDDNCESGTVEVRLNSGTMDHSEVLATYEFMGKLMLWLSTPDIDHTAVILSIWADANSTLLDVVKLVGASQTTLDYYTDRLSSDWAIRRHSRLTSSIDPNDPFKCFKLAIENNRLKDSRREAVDAKISQKLEAGYYGQLSGDLFKTLAPEFQNHPDANVLNKDTCDHERWAVKAIADYKTSIAEY